MVATTPNSGWDDFAPQEELADSLVQCMGRESAIHVCLINGWKGVLDIIQRRDASSGPANDR